MRERYLNTILGNEVVSLTALSRKSYSLGIGGFFSSQFLPDLKLENLVSFELENDITLKGIGKVVWTRASPTDDGPAGHGIEILNLDLGSINFIENYIKNFPKHPYIPIK